MRVAYGVASGAGLGLVAQDLAAQRSARSRYESDAWDSLQSLGSRERAGGDAYGSRGRRRLRVAYGVASGAGLGLGVGPPQRREPALAKQLKVELALPGAVEEGPPLVAGVVKYWSVRILGVADRDPAALREDGDLDAGAVAAGRGFPPRESVGIVIR